MDILKNINILSVKTTLDLIFILNVEGRVFYFHRNCKLLIKVNLNNIIYINSWYHLCELFKLHFHLIEYQNYINYSGSFKYLVKEAEFQHKFIQNCKY